MKKLVLLLSVAVLFTVACEKEEVSPVAVENKDVKAQKEPNDKADPYFPKNYRLFFDEIRYPTGCVPFSGDCFPQDVVIRPSMAGTVDDLFNVLEHGEQSAIQLKFSNYSDFLIEILSKEMSEDLAQTIIDEVVSGDLEVNGIHNTIEKDGNTDRFIRFVSSNNQKQVLVLPFTTR